MQEVNPNLATSQVSQGIAAEAVPKTRTGQRRWLWYLMGFIVFAIIVIVIVVPSVVVTQKKQSSKQQGDQNVSSPVTTNEPTASPPYAHIVSAYANLTRVQTYPDMQNKKRVFVIGDIHGCAQEFKELVDQINYDPEHDQIILAGDLVYRGPDNIGVIRYAKQINALCVRGNHDDKVIRLKTYEMKHGSDAMQPEDAVMPEGDVEDPLKFGDDHTAIARYVEKRLSKWKKGRLTYSYYSFRNMTQEDYDYLVSCPLIMHLPNLNNSVIVHGGLDPKVNPLVNNDPWSVENIRDIKDDVPLRDNDKGHHWTKDWDDAQKNSSNPLVVYYGHDASRGLDLGTYTFGIDSGCVRGGKLTALEMKSHTLAQVTCQEYTANEDS